MRRTALALVALLVGCATEPPHPPVLIPEASGPPVDCRQLLAVTLPQGSTAEDVISAQHLAILAYEARIKACGIVPTK